MPGLMLAGQAKANQGKSLPKTKSYTHLLDSTTEVCTTTFFVELSTAANATREAD
jgi:hypothetical protein